MQESICGSCGEVMEEVPESERYELDSGGIPLHPDIVNGKDWKGWQHFYGSDDYCDECGSGPRKSLLEKIEQILAIPSDPTPRALRDCAVLNDVIARLLEMPDATVRTALNIAPGPVDSDNIQEHRRRARECWRLAEKTEQRLRKEKESQDHP